MKKRIVSIIIAGLATAGFVGAVAPVALADQPSPANGCGLYANRPFKEGSNAVATGGRGDSCISSMPWVSIRLMHQQAGPLPDTIVASNTYNGSGNVDGRAQTTARGGAVYYTRTVDSSGATATSSTNSF